MSNFSDRVKESLPSHYLDDYPKFVTFFEKYYEWLYREGGITSAEKQIMLADKKWLRTSIDNFIQTGEILDIASTENEIEQAIQLISDKRTPGAVSKNLIPDYVLERKFDGFNTSDEEVFETADDHNLESKYRNRDAIEAWVTKQGFFLPDTGSDVGRLDEILLVRLIKHINSIKGTQKAAELFFSMFFDEDINLNNGGNGAFFKPKYHILTIDEKTTAIDQKTAVIRDDWFYNEFAYVIRVQREPEFYKMAFESIYLKYIHPAGFKCFLVQATEDEIVRQVHRFFRASQATYMADDGFLHLVGYDIARTEGGVLLVESAATNLLQWSIDADTTTGWTLGANTTKIGKTLSPFGSQNATVYQVNGASQGISQIVSVEANTDYVLSVWLKLISGTDPSGFLQNRWIRSQFTFNSGASTTYTAILRKQGAALPNGTQFAISSAQLEKGTVASSYIPTYVSSASRAADVVIDAVA